MLPVAAVELNATLHQNDGLAPGPVLVFRPKGAPPKSPVIEPPCPDCVDTRATSGGRQYWCEQHRTRKVQRHVDRDTSHHVLEQSNLPLVLDQRRHATWICERERS